MRTSGAHWGTFYQWWDATEFANHQYWLKTFDGIVRTIAESAQMEPVAVLIGTPKWASARIDSHPPLDSGIAYDSDTSTYCAPRGLAVGDTAPNYWVRYLDTLLTHRWSDDTTDTTRPASLVHSWSIWNEENEGATTWVRGDSWPGYTGWWRRPNVYYDIANSVHDMCSLYVRLCVLAAESIRAHPGHDSDRIIIGELGRVNYAQEDIRLVPGKEWLRTFYGIVERNQIPHFWSTVSVHPYQTGWNLFCPDSFAANAETLRAVMREHGDTVQLWNSEFDCGTRGTVTAKQNANSLCEAFTSVPAQAGLPGGTFDRICWWRSWCDSGCGSWSLFDSIMKPRPGFFAFKQVIRALTGKRFNGRVMTGDAGTDALVRMYEFEDTTTLKRTWVCWKNGGQGSGAVSVKVPARADSVTAESLAYDPNSDAVTRPASLDGWFPAALTDRPVFMTETGDTSRPDLRTDSIRLDPPHPRVGMPETVHAWVKNHGTRSTPWNRNEPGPFPTEAVLFWNGESIARQIHYEMIDTGETVQFDITLACVSDSLHGLSLFSVQANPGQRDYVELAGTDDNAGYKRVYIPLYPTGVVDAIVPPGGKTNVALLPMRFTSHSWESDSTGQQSADSMRIIFSWFGQRDSVVHAADTTAWFPFCQDTVLRFPRGSGKYRAYVQYRDSGADDSPLICDPQDSIIVFDTTAAIGSVVINHGGRFAPCPICTLRLSAHDSASGVGWMHFSNGQPRNLVRNSAFVASDGIWEFYGSGGYDTSVNMAWLKVDQYGEYVRQFIAPESIQAHFNDSCVLEASILSRVRGQVSGDVSFSYWYTRQDTSQHDTLWTQVSSASYSGDFLSLTGRYNLASHFQLAPPAPYQDWVWRGGVVKVKGQTDGNVSGTVWTDNVSMGLFQVQPGLAWWGTYDTLSEWSLGGPAGEHIVRGMLLDSAGTANAVPFADSIILDPTPPDAHISLPQEGQYVNGQVEITGWAYDPIEVAGDTWFVARRLFYRPADSTNWLPVQPDSVSFAPAYPNWNNPGSPAVHLGYWCTDSLADGEYWLRVAATDSSGHLTTDDVWVVVKNDTTGDSSHAGPGGGGSGMGGGSVYIGSSTGRVLHLSDALDSLGGFTVTDSGSAAYVTAILEVGNDSLLVLDARNRRIHKMHRSGQNRRRLVSSLTLPVALVQDSHSNFWLVDKGVSRIGKFRRDGTLVFTRGGLGADSLHFNSPEAIAVKRSLVYVADTKNDRVVVWDTNGVYKANIKGDFSNPTAVMVTDSGTIYLTDGSDGKLKGITPLGGSIVIISASGGSKLRGLVPSENGHSLFSLAPQPNVVHKLRIQSDDSLPGGVQSAGNLNLPKLLTLAQPFPNPARTRLTINYALPRQARVTLKLYDIAGKLVTTLANGDQRPGYYHIAWNRQDSRGRSVPAGVYFCSLAAEGQRFSRKVVLTE
jgi:hypothetical protein